MHIHSQNICSARTPAEHDYLSDKEHSQGRCFWWGKNFRWADHSGQQASSILWRLSYFFSPIKNGELLFWHWQKPLLRKNSPWARTCLETTDPPLCKAEPLLLEGWKFWLGKHPDGIYRETILSIITRWAKICRISIVDQNRKLSAGNLPSATKRPEYPYGRSGEPNRSRLTHWSEWVSDLGENPMANRKKGFIPRWSLVARSTAIYPRNGEHSST